MNKTRTKKWKRVQIKGVDRVTRNLGFQGYTEAQRKEWKSKAQHVVHCIQSGLAMSPHIANWLSIQSDANVAKLRRLGIELERDRLEKYQLSQVVSHFLSEKSTEVGDRSMQKYEANAQRLLDYFGKSKDVRSIEVKDAKQFVQYLIADEGLAGDSSAARATGYANSFFVSAVHRKLVTDNPFFKLAKTVQPNEDKHHYICPEQTKRLWSVIDNDEDRVRFVLLRYLGLRSPSEMNELRSTDFNFRTHKVQIRSPKLVKYRTYKRHCPFNNPNALPVIEKYYRDNHRNNDYDAFLPTISHEQLSERVAKWISDADLDQWPSLLTNFRRSAITDAADTGVAVATVAEWFGNSEKIAKRHYMLETDRHAETMRQNAIVMLDHTADAA